MRRLLCPVFPKPGAGVELEEGEARHAVQVLRLREGDEVELLDGAGNRLRAHLRIRKNQVFVDDFGAEPESARAGEVVPLDLGLAVLKGEAMEWAIEKCVELGVRSILPLFCDRSVVLAKSKGEDEFRERWQRIADQALKQCGRLNRMEISRPATFQEDLFRGINARVFFADEAEAGSAELLSDSLRGVGEARILIGPEGGWSEKERAILAGVSKVSLGPLILRAETAAVFAASVGRALLSSKN